MNDSFGAGGFTQQNGAAKQENKAEGTLPVFIKQIKQQKDDTIKFWGFEYKMITIVAIVRNIEHSSTKVTYELQDLTGRITAHLWVEEGDAPSGAGLMLNTYARVIGAVRQQGDVKTIMIYKIQPVSGINEVNTHYLEVVNARYQAEEYFRGSTGAGGAIKMEVESNATQASAGTQSGPKGKSLAVYNAIQASSETHPDTGISRQELLRKFPNIQPRDLEGLINELSNDGHIYSTIDPDHFLTCA